MLIKMVLAGKSEAKVDAGDLLLKLSVSIMLPLLVGAGRSWPAVWAAWRCWARQCLPALPLLERAERGAAQPAWCSRQRGRPGARGRAGGPGQVAGGP
jgi:hypothetical protein